MGSFLNVVILRLPAGESVVRPRSRCPACRRPIPWFENLPVLSFLLLRARCRGCGGRISWRYPLVEALTGALFAAATWLLVVRFPGGVQAPERWGLLAAALPFLGALVALTGIDLDHRILPDRITKPGMVAGAVLSVAFPALQRPEGLGGLPPAGGALLLSLAGMALGYWSLWLVAFLGERALGREAMGLGDAKLLAMIGAFVGPLGTLLAAAIGLAVGLLLGGLRLLLTRDASFPFGPALAVGGAAVLLDRPLVEEGLRRASAFAADPRGGLAVTALCAVLLLWIRARLPRLAFLAMAVLVLALGVLNGLLLARR